MKEKNENEAIVVKTAIEKALHTTFCASIILFSVMFCTGVIISIVLLPFPYIFSSIAIWWIISIFSTLIIADKMVIFFAIRYILRRVRR